MRFNVNKDLPMDRTSTLSILHKRIIIDALKNEKVLSPSEKTIDFIRDFARNFKILDGVPPKIQSLSLN